VRTDLPLPGARKRWQAILSQRCPRCLEGKIYASLLRMQDDCPACRHHFEREPGYFLVAMYISYPLSIVVIGLSLWAITSFWPDMRLEWAVLLTVPILILCVPALVRWSRVLWMHWDPPHY
jgi:uncharacterized protein (DUF983 family)